MSRWGLSIGDIKFEQKLIDSKFRPAGFDYMRIVLALCVIVLHSFPVSTGKNWSQVKDPCLDPSLRTAYDCQHRPVQSADKPRPDAAALSTPAGPASKAAVPAKAGHAPGGLLQDLKKRLRIGDFILPMFFSLSGFLVCGSLERCRTLISFAGFRILRICPALAVEVTLSALLIGPMLSGIPLWSYFTDPRLYAYLLNMVGDIHYFLPGVFAHNPIPHVVNAQLWTIPFELLCYTTLAATYLVGIFNRRMILLATVVALNLAFVADNFLHIHTAVSDAIRADDGVKLVLMFLAGIVLFRFRDRVPWSAPLFAASIVLTLVLRLFPVLQGADAFPVAYITMYLGLCNPPRNKIVLSGDYSYGVYIYGFPIQQVVASLGSPFQHWYINLLISVPVIVAIAVLSWHLVEKGALKAKVVFNRLEDGFIRMRDAGFRSLSLPAKDGSAVD